MKYLKINNFDKLDRQQIDDLIFFIYFFFYLNYCDSFYDANIINRDH